MRLLLVCAGGAVGSGARYLTAIWAASALSPKFPYGTFIVNVLGSFLIAFIMHIGSATELLPADLRVMLTAGVMGGFTTYSTFNYETTNYFRQGVWSIGMLNIAATVMGCLIAGCAGLMLARVLVGR